MKTDTFEFGKAIVEVGNARTRFEYLLNSKQVASKSRDIIRGYINRLRFIENDVTAMLSPEAKSIMQQQLMNDEDRLQADAIMSMFIALPKEARDRLETYLEMEVQNIMTHG